MNLKKINDSFGHLTGDEILQRVSQRLENVVRDSDFLARIGGDEFVIITDAIENKEEVYPLVKRIQQQFEQAFNVGSHEITATCSIGVAYYPDAENLDLLIKHADCAMYEAKGNPNASTCFYSDQIAAQYARAQKLESFLGSAIEKKEIYSVFQPIIHVVDENEIHVEALARWHSDLLGDISPDEFIPIAESSPAINGVTHAITQRVQSLVEIVSNNGQSIDRISINVSAHQLACQNFSKQFLTWLKHVNISPNKICIELTERQVVQNIAQCKEQFLCLKNQGVQLALDDYGSGFSSVTHLLDLPFDILKLDRQLVSYIDKNSRNQALVAGIVEMAHRLNMKVVAEGVEREKEKQKVIDLGCDYIQGFLISKPLPLHETALFYELRR